VTSSNFGSVNSHAANPLSAEREIIQLYERWPARRHSAGADRPREFFAWLKANHSHLTEFGVFGYRRPYEHIRAIIARWEGTYGRGEGRQ